MSLSRRGFFGMLAGLAASPALAPLAKLSPEPILEYQYKTWGPNGVQDHLATYYTHSLMSNLLSNLRSNTPLMTLLSDKPLPTHTGKEIKFFTYLPKAAL